MNTKENIAAANAQIEKDWGFMHYALHNLKMQAKQDVAEAILSVMKDHGPKDRPVAGSIMAANLIKQRINTATLIAVKLGNYTYEQMRNEWLFETGQTFKVTA